MALSRPILVSRTRRKTFRSVRKLVPIALATIASILLIISLLPVSDIRKIDLRGVTWTSREEIQMAIAQGMTGRAIGLIPRTRWMYSSSASMKEALQDIPTLSEVNVWKIIPGMITVHVKEHEPWATIMLSGKTYVVGTEGQILGDVSAGMLQGITPERELIRGEISENERYGIGEHLFTEERATAIERWSDELKAQGFIPSLWRFSSPHAPDVSIMLVDGWELRIDPTMDPTRIIPQVKRILDEVVKERLSTLQAIDARSPTALYTKFK